MPDTTTQQERQDRARARRGNFGVPRALEEYRALAETGAPGTVAVEATRLLEDAEVFRAALSPARLPAGSVPRPQLGTGAQEFEEEDSDERRFAPALGRARTNLIHGRLKRGRGLLAPGFPGGIRADEGSALAREILADSVVERARVLAEFDDPADAFVRRDARHLVPGWAPWEAAPRLAGAGIQTAPFFFTAPSREVLWGSALALAGAPTDVHGRDASGGVSGENAIVSSLVCLGIGWSATGLANGRSEEPEEDTTAVLGAARMEDVLVSVIHGLEAPYRGRRQASRGERTDGLRPGEKFRGQRRWEDARRDFAAAEERLRRALVGVRALEEALLGRATLERAAMAATDAEARLRADLLKRSAEEAHALRDLAGRDEELYGANEDLKRHRRMKPGLVARLFLPDRERAWLRSGKKLARRYDGRLARAEEAAALLDERRGAHEEARERLSSGVREERDARKRLERARARIHEGAQSLGAAAPDPDLYSEDQAERRGALDRSVAPSNSPAAPYLSAEVQRAREGLFAAALALHRDFALVCARPVAENLRALLQLVREEIPWSDRPLSVPQDPGESSASPSTETRDLLVTLALVAPASGLLVPSPEAAALLGPLKREASGWIILFGHEPSEERASAGDTKAATPKAPAEIQGVLFRARRALFLPAP